MFLHIYIYIYRKVCTFIVCWMYTRYLYMWVSPPTTAAAATKKKEETT